MGKNKPMPHNTLRLCEALFDITQAGSAMIRNGKIETENFGELFGPYLTPVRQFEEEQLKIENGYMPAIEDFAAGGLAKHYGRVG